MIPKLPILTNVNIHRFHTFQSIFKHIPRSICLFYVFGNQHCLPQDLRGNFGGTTVILYGTSDSLIVAADSKATVAKDKPADFLVCKIWQLDDNTFFTMAGLFGNMIKHVDLPKEIRNFWGSLRSGRLSDKATQSARLLESTSLLAIAPRRDSTMPIAQLLFFGRENDSLKAMLRTFLWQDAFSKIVHKPENHEWFTKIHTQLLLSEGEPHIYSAVMQTFKLPSLISRVQAIADTAAVYDSLRTGHPFDIICVTKSSAVWIKKKKECD